jgi:Flp pilus assembly protein TadD
LAKTGRRDFLGGNTLHPFKPVIGQRSSLEPSPVDLRRWQKAQQDLLKGRAEAALTTYRDLTGKYPDRSELWFELGLAAAKELDFDLADRAFQRTAELSPNDASMRILLGQQYHLLRRMDRARSCFEAASAIDPASVPAQLSLAEWYERERRLEDAWAVIETCAGRHPKNLQVRYFRAMLLHRRGANLEAEKALRELIQEGSADANLRHAIRHQLAVILDELGQHDEAMRWLHESKAVLRTSQNISKLEQVYDQADRRRRSLLAELKPETIRRWRNETSKHPPRNGIAFLGGHPRSGTTLLEQILGAHPDIAAFDEPMAFTQEILEPLAPLDGAALTLKNLDQLNEPRQTRFQQRYLVNLLRENTDRADAAVLLDKNPSHTASIHLWLRIFPLVRVIIALRDPRDVIVSCFFQNLQLNTTNANFLSLDRTVKHYADLMDVWLRLRELGEFDWVESRYEDVVTGMESEGQRVTKFLALQWHPSQAAYHENARKKFVFAPTYNEVTRPVHQRAVNRWQKYESTLAPLQERLAPYCRAFGYE